jgi:hypothetical protein
MSRHRSEPPPRVAPRYGRIGAAGISTIVTLVALLAGIGIIPVDGNRAVGASDQTGSRISANEAALVTGATSSTKGAISDTKPDGSTALATKTIVNALPARSGDGKRVVFDMSAQRVWLVNAKDAVVRTYLVSGSLTDNLHPGSYHVYSKSRWAVGVDDSGVMQYFVRFTRGNNAAIGFHSIPTKFGKLLQTRAQLGTPQSHGCIRQYIGNAKRLWAFAPVGTSVVVTA